MYLSSVLDVLVGGALLGGVYGVAAVGFNLQYGVARVLNVGHGEFVTLGAFLTWWLYVGGGVNPFLGLLVAVGVGFGLGWAGYHGVFARLRERVRTPEEFEAACMLASFGVLFVMQNLVILLWGGEVRSYSYLPRALHMGSIAIPLNRLAIFLFAGILGVGFYGLLLRTRIGKAIRASAQDAFGASSLGVEVTRVLGICFALGTAAAAGAGALISMAFSIHPVMGFEYTVMSIVVAVLGGLGSLPGSLLGGVLLGVVGLAVTHWQPGLAVVAYYLLFVVLLWWRPRGMLAT